MAESKGGIEPAVDNEAGQLMRLITEGKNARGIPMAKFIVCDRYASHFDLVQR